MQEQGWKTTFKSEGNDNPHSFGILTLLPAIMRLLALTMIFLVASTLAIPAGKSSGKGRKGSGGKGNGGSKRSRSSSPEVVITKEVIHLGSDSSDSDTSSASSSPAGGCCDDHCVEVGCDCVPYSSDCIKQQARLLKKKEKKEKGSGASKKDGNNNRRPGKGGGSGKSKPGKAGGKSKRGRVHRRDTIEE